MGPDEVRKIDVVVGDESARGRDGESADGALRPGEWPEVEGAAGGTVSRPWIGVLFECCGVYARVYRRGEEKCYSVRCPRCGGGLRVRVSADGVSERVFRARPG